MGRLSREKHPGEETLHAYAAGEVPDGPVRAAIAGHVAQCGSCAEALARVGAMRELFSSMAPDPLDDLRWARLARRVQAELRSPGRAAGEGLRGWSWLSGLSGDWTRWWAPVAVIAATGLATVLVVNAWPRGAVAPAAAPAVTSVASSGSAARSPGSSMADARVDLAASAREDDVLPAGAPAVLHGASTPVRFTLESGLQVQLGPAAEVRFVESSLDRVKLELERGEVEVWSADDRFGPDVELRAPDLLATSKGSTRFRVARLAGAPTALQIERGEVRVARAELSSPAPSPSPVRVAGASPSDAAERGADRPAEREGARDADTRARGPVPTPVRGAARASAAPADPWAAVLSAYEAGRLEEAVTRAQALLEGPHDDDQSRRVWRLVCDAQLALDRPRAAAAACESLLPLISGDEARVVHFRVATIHRARLGDCPRATAHYDQMVVVGSTALIDQDALLGRAECALMAGDLDGAARDLGFLRGQALARPAAYDVLSERLGRARDAHRKGDR